MIRLYSSAQSAEFYRKIDLPTLQQVRNARTYAVRTENGALLIEFNWLDESGVTAYADDRVCRILTDCQTIAMRSASIDNDNGFTELFDFFIALTATDIYELEKLEDRVEDLEDQLFEGGKPTESGIDLILEFRKEVLHKKRYYEQMELLSDELADLDHRFDFIDKKFDRLYDILLRTQEYVEQVREAYQSQIDIEQNKIDVEQNKIMRILTIVTTVLSPLTLITGWFGMNLRMPEQNWRFGYLYVIILCLIVAIGTILYFRRKKWL
ncbi:MAG: hypothetical protein IJ133_03685 [Clostridia bacterium]|nr:hypothetical protein [Clostridia bacterium]